MEKPLHREVHVFNGEDNGGESLTLTTDYFDNGDAAHGLPDGIYWNQKLTLASYCNSASFELAGAVLTPESLRELADILENGQSIALSKVRYEKAIK
jgi:hypothetical protein